MFNELSFNFDLTHSLKLRYFYNCIPIQTDPCQDKIKFKSYMLWFCFCFFNTYKKQLHMKARLRKDKMCFSSSSKSCKKKLGLCPSRVLPGTPPPPRKKLQIEFAREAAYRMSLIEIRLGGWGSEGPTLGRHVSACATILSLHALLFLRASHQCVRYYIVTSLERLGQVAGAVSARRVRHQASTLVRAPPFCQEVEGYSEV